jgi:DNA-directed RNA polymerase subunit M/transcription elongation factor TFIIS
MSLNKIKCPICGELLIPHDEIVKQANSFNDCLRRCESCKLGFSNEKNNPTMIYKNYIDNVPELLRHDLDFVLSNSLNLINRVSVGF